MIVTKTYERPNGPFNYAVFDVVAGTLEELKAFVEGNQTALHKYNLREDEEESLKITFHEAQRVVIETLVYRFNMVRKGEHIQLGKRDFLENFAMEAVKGIVYATGYSPKDLDIDEYVTGIIKAFEEYGDNELFQQRMFNISGAENYQDIVIVAKQIELINNLLSIPLFEEESITNEEGSDN